MAAVERELTSVVCEVVAEGLFGGSGGVLTIGMIGRCTGLA